MRLSINFAPVAKKLGYEDGIRACAAAGYDALDMGFFSMKSGESPFLRDDYRSLCDTYLAMAKENNVVFNQAHAPFGSPYAKYSVESVPHFPRMFECCARLGVETVIIHPVQDGRFYGHEEELLERSVEFYKSLIPMAREFGVKIATENMWQRDARGYIVDDTCASPEHFARCVDTVNSEWLVACLDIGHVALCGREPADFIRALGRDRLKALHVHDNDLIHDSHVAPYSGKIDWMPVCHALAEIGYAGDFTYEIDSTISSTPPELCPDMLKYTHEIGRYLISNIK
ncbi:MAG: sugar phosphate isomerase/epimerase [Clostridia bacterium]|nr:sugar phosphate isomerase/epimerase [Clostridia bacterium]